MKLFWLWGEKCKFLHVSKILQRKKPVMELRNFRIRHGTKHLPGSLEIKRKEKKKRIEIKSINKTK